MDYRFSVKALPQSDDPAAQAQDPAAGQPPEPQPHQDDARPWAGDVYDDGDETDPAQAFAAFSGPNGEQAWLDKAQDGTLTGWVRDETGQVYRYVDPDTWAIDVDDAGMTQTGGQMGASDPQASAGGTPADPNAGPAAADPNADPNADPGMDPGMDPNADPAGDGSGLSLDYGTADEAVPPDPSAGDPSQDGTDPGTEDDPMAKKKRRPRR